MVNLNTAIKIFHWLPGKVIGRVHLSLSDCLSVGAKMPVLQIQAILLVLNTFKLCKTLIKIALFVLLLEYTLQVVKSCVLS